MAACLPQISPYRPTWIMAHGSSLLDYCDYVAGTSVATLLAARNSNSQLATMTKPGNLQAKDDALSASQPISSYQLAHGPTMFPPPITNDHVS
jgi:hypothetical protein